MAELSMSTPFSFDSLDPVDMVLKTDENLEKAIANAATAGADDAETIIRNLEESGEILEAREDYSYDEEDLDESTFDLSNPVDMCMLESLDEKDDDKDNKEDSETGAVGESAEYDDYDEFVDEDGELIDEVMEDDTHEPGSVQDQEDSDIIDAVDNDQVDSTGYQIEDALFEDSEFDLDDLDEGCAKDAVDMVDDDDEAITEDLNLDDDYGF